MSPNLVVGFYTAWGPGVTQSELIEAIPQICPGGRLRKSPVPLGVIELLGVRAVHVVPPVARQEGLAEEGEVRAEVGVEAAALLTDVKQLELKMA